MEAQVVFNSVTNLFDLVLEINGVKETVSTSKSYGHWQYHFNRGTLAKGLAKYNIKTFAYIGFTPDKPPPTNETKVQALQEAESSWFETKALSLTVSKKRGRPRKFLPNVIGVSVHKLGDHEPAVKPETIDRAAVERNFKMFIRTMDVKEALDEIMLKFKIPYKQAYDIVGSYI